MVTLECKRTIFNGEQQQDPPSRSQTNSDGLLAGKTSAAKKTMAQDEMGVACQIFTGLSRKKWELVTDAIVTGSIAARFHTVDGAGTVDLNQPDASGGSHPAIWLRSPTMHMTLHLFVPLRRSLHL